ncbi:hypothetical protein J7I98_13890 [Streptomyces sp. ISL-98]|uniref:hypothetical protein n=1 Tax=Streptomyces sp. ISL-98 TaxID=2819192 RepID=UPI001BE51B17|nr:hypothetical protein [Streptomyces sp. ISL-98]MBT2506962.1 hypothetical protein [Streptomyces sp. ISL-98]
MRVAWSTASSSVTSSGCSHACRWAALRNQANGLDIVATVIRQDGRWARLHNDAYFARSACADFAYNHRLDEPGRLPAISGRAKSRNLRILSP